MQILPSKWRACCYSFCGLLVAVRLGGPLWILTAVDMSVLFQSANLIISKLFSKRSFSGKYRLRWSGLSVVPDDMTNLMVLGKPAEDWDVVWICAKTGNHDRMAHLPYVCQAISTCIHVDPSLCRNWVNMPSQFWWSLEFSSFIDSKSQSNWTYFKHAIASVWRLPRWKEKYQYSTVYIFITIWKEKKWKCEKANM